jgi:acetoacetyl-CoA synthetase
MDKAVNPGSVDNVELLRFYERLAQDRTEQPAEG